MSTCLLHRLSVPLTVSRPESPGVRPVVTRVDVQRVSRPSSNRTSAQLTSPTSRHGIVSRTDANHSPHHGTVGRHHQAHERIHMVVSTPLRRRGRCVRPRQRLADRLLDNDTDLLSLPVLLPRSLGSVVAHLRLPALRLVLRVRDARLRQRRLHLCVCVSRFTVSHSPSVSVSVSPSLRALAVGVRPSESVTRRCADSPGTLRH